MAQTKQTAQKKFYKTPAVTTCPLKGKEDKINYRNVQLLEKFISTRGRLMPSEKTGVCASNQRRLKIAIKQARYMALLPYSRYV
jgi:small subunit ribosomal protein S18